MVCGICQKVNKSNLPNGVTTMKHKLHKNIACLVRLFSSDEVTLLLFFPTTVEAPNKGTKSAKARRVPETSNDIVSKVLIATPSRLKATLIHPRYYVT